MTKLDRLAHALLARAATAAVIARKLGLTLPDTRSALGRLLRKGEAEAVGSVKRPEGGRRPRIYALTAKGREQCKKKLPAL